MFLVLYVRFRDGLVEAALQGGLVPALLSRLDWQQADSSGVGTVAQTREDGSRGEAGGGGEERGASVARVLAVSVLRLLAADGAHSSQVLLSTVYTIEHHRLTQQSVHIIFSGPRRVTETF